MLTLYMKSSELVYSKFQFDQESGGRRTTIVDVLPLNHYLIIYSCIYYVFTQSYFEDRLQNSPYFCVFKYARAVKQKVCNEAEAAEARFAHARLLATLYQFLY